MVECEECKSIWRAYENAVFEHVRLCSKLSLAEAAHADDAVCNCLAVEVSRAERKRADRRSAVLAHEANCGAHRGVVITTATD